MTSSNRKDARKKGDGYITRQGYHLVYLEGKYVPYHRSLFPDIPDAHVVHHIDGNKLNNKLGNLYPCSKDEHRKLHGTLERLGYHLIQQGLIEFTEEGYRFSTHMKKFVCENSMNSGEPGSSNVDGNPEPSLVIGRCNDYPGREYTQARGRMESPNQCN